MWYNTDVALLKGATMSLILVHCAAASPNPLQADPPLCSKDLFGSPQPNDCYQAMFWIPYINAPARHSPDAAAPRIFAEPRFLSPPFGAAKNPYAPKAIVQLPKIWKFGTLIHICILSRVYMLLHSLCSDWALPALILKAFFRVMPYSSGAPTLHYLL